MIFVAALEMMSCVFETAKCLNLKPPFGIAQVGQSSVHWCLKLSTVSH